MVSAYFLKLSWRNTFLKDVDISASVAFLSFSVLLAPPGRMYSIVSYIYTEQRSTAAVYYTSHYICSSHREGRISIIGLRCSNTIGNLRIYTSHVPTPHVVLYLGLTPAKYDLRMYKGLYVCCHACDASYNVCKQLCFLS